MNPASVVLGCPLPVWRFRTFLLIMTYSVCLVVSKHSLASDTVAFRSLSRPKKSLHIQSKPCSSLGLEAPNCISVYMLYRRSFEFVVKKPEFEKDVF